MKNYSKHNLVIGLLLVIFGLGFLGENLNLGDFSSIIFKFWPLALIFVGLAELLSKKANSAIFWLVVGVLFLLNTLDIIHTSFWALFWPVLLILFGVNILFREPKRQSIKDEGDTISTFSVFGGDDRKAESKSFKLANLTAIFGGSKIDLRNSGIDKEGAIIDVLIVFGGGELILPKNSNVKIDVIALFGGTDDKRTNIATDETVNKIRIRGTVLFGGLEIKD